jgi:hypothetical protein
MAKADRRYRKDDSFLGGESPASSSSSGSFGNKSSREDNHHSSSDCSSHEDDDESEGNDRIPLVLRQPPRHDESALASTATAGWRRPCSTTTRKPGRTGLAVVAAALVLAFGLFFYDWSSPDTPVGIGSSVVKRNETSSSASSFNATVSATEEESTVTPTGIGGPKDLPSEGDQSTHNPKELPVNYACPNAPPRQFESKMDGAHHRDWYEKESSRLVGDIRNVSEYMKVFRESEFDNWGHSYKEVKRGMYRWKSKQFADLVPKGGDGNSDSAPKLVYESACGIGLNLYMTLEILHESTHASVSHIVAYGNEYQRDSTLLARAITSSSHFPGQPGTICQSDSSNLSYVPSNSFDLVYTGYISPLADPLRLADQYDIDEDEDLYGRYTEYCEAKAKDGDDDLHARAQRAQHYQEKWYASWASEMIRIAKPGAKIIVEQVSYPLCEALYDWGGVSQHFWKRAADNYAWQVDPNTFEYQDDTIFRHRYHLMMRKLSS